MTRRTSKRADKAAAVGFPICVDASVVDTVLVSQMRQEFSREDLVVDVRIGVRGTLPLFLRRVISWSTHDTTIWSAFLLLVILWMRR